MRSSTKIAIVHDWLTAPGGAERVLEQLLRLYPAADLFCICDFLDAKHRSLLCGRTPKTSFIQTLPWASKKHWMYLALMPLAIEQFDLSEYDLIISSSYAVAKGVLTGPEQLHISYVYTPIRYAWQLQHQYLKEMKMDAGPLSWMVRIFLHYLRIWDLRSAVGVDRFISISEYVARQVRKLYNVESEVLHPPVDLARFSLYEDKEHFFITASRLVPYKRIDLIVSAFAAMPQHRLVVIGDGPERKRVDAAAKGYSNIEIMGYQSDEVLRDLVSRAKAFVFAAIEDFGIAPLEAQASGTPVIALARGGALETIRPIDSDHPTGVFFADQTEASLIDAVAVFEREGHRILPKDCRSNAERFSAQTFGQRFSLIVEQAIVNDGRITTTTP